MKTPITDAKIKAGFTADERRGQEVPANLARRLELDRAALMDALEEIKELVARYSESSLSFGVVNSKAETALAAARANFPTP